MYRIDKADKSFSRTTRDLMVLALIVLLLANAVQFFSYQKGAGQELSARAAFVTRIKLDLDNARAALSQVSRTGGTTAATRLSEVRQYLYGISQINDLALGTYGGKPWVTSAAIAASFTALDMCIARLAAGQAIDTQLAELRTQMERIADDIARLSV